MVSRPFGDGLTEYVIRSRCPLLLEENVGERARALGIAPVGRPSLAWMGVPMIIEDRAIGMIGIQDYERANCYGPTDLKLLVVISGQAAAAIRNTRLLAAARRAYRELSDAQARLLEAERLRGVTETVGTLNHEVNNPLSAISGNAQLLLRAARSLEADVRRKVESILESARRIQQVTSKMETLIRASSISYPGGEVILDVNGSVSNDELIAGAARPGAPRGADPY
jgi:signal transduction histidine kinase